jgi:tetratricopeptide (TPR) repeat protein
MAKQQLFQALNLNSDSTLLNLIYMNLSKVYEREQTIDSAVYFAKLSILLGEKRNDLYSLYANYKILARLEEKNGNYQNAMNYYKKGFTSYTKIQTKNTVDIQGIETKHELNMLKNKHRYCMRAIRLACLALVIIAFFLIRYIRKNKLKSAQRQSEMNEREERINNELTKIKQELIAKDNCINKIQDEMNEKEKFVKLYLDTLMALHKKLEQSLSDLSILSDENKKHAEKVINSLLSVFSTNNTWKMIYNAGKSTFDEIRKQYPELSEQEFKIVCLDVLNYSNAMIADITGMKQTTIQKQKSDLRKKLNIEDGGKISSCIRSQVG